MAAELYLLLNFELNFTEYFDTYRRNSDTFTKMTSVNIKEVKLNILYFINNLYYF